MSQTLTKSLLLPIAIIVACYGAAISLSRTLDREKPHLPAGYEDADITVKGSKFKGFLLGSESLVADWYWMRALQYVGNKMENATVETTDLEDLRALNIKLLYPYLDNATDLDPHFLAAYNYGAIVMPAIDPAQAIAIAEKGIANNPNEWRLYQHLGYIYWRLKMYDKAAETYEKGSAIPGVPGFMKLMAASMKNNGGSRDTARSIYRQMLAADDDAVKPTAELRLKQLDSIDERDAIYDVLSSFKAKNNRCANSFAEITPLLLQVKLPEGRSFTVDNNDRLVDPTGAPYLLDKESCRANLDPEKTALPQN